jgi:hypothetical protein
MRSGSQTTPERGEDDAARLDRLVALDAIVERADGAVEQEDAGAGHLGAS